MKEVQEENFYALVEQYLDYDVIKEKLEEDKCDNNSSHTSESPFSVEDTISINEYVNNFLNIQTNAKRLYHCGLKDLMCPYVVGVSNEFANKNPEYVKSGFLLIVIDSRNNRGTYLNPFYLHQILEKEQTERMFREVQKTKLRDLKKLCSFFSNYVLLEHKVEKNNEFHEILKSQKKLRKVNIIRRYEKIGE